MDCLAILNSGNYVFKLCSILEKKGYVFEIVSTPCQIARDGCGYCLKLPIEHMELVIAEGRANGLPVKEIFKIIPGFTKNKYEKVY
ncbi:MAG TPA: DUF3343 domain-containing protein [Ruminiclostridium sp.]|nr:DUF3343 domain-containing protein [Ruminiclostridium sp.]